MLNKKSIVLLVVLTLFPAVVYCKTLRRAVQSEENPFRLGLGYPYLALRYRAVELKYSFEPGIDIYGARVNLNLMKRRSFNLYTGLEGDIIRFNTEDLQGTGEVILPFIGSELFLSRKMSFYIDIGPGNITVKDSLGYDGNVSGVEWIMNTGIWIYF